MTPPGVNPARAPACGIVALRTSGVNAPFRTFSGLPVKLGEMRILVVDDEPAVRRSGRSALTLEGYAVPLAREGAEAAPAGRGSVRSALTLEGYEVRLARGGAEALDVLASERVDAIVLDLLMPGVDGLEVCRRLRADGDPTPVLMLTVRHLVSDRVAGLDAGAGDYLTKPFSLDELLARMRALLRRASGTGEVLRFADLTLDVDTREAHRGDRLIRLTP